MASLNFELLHYGIFDSAMKFQNLSVSKKRTVCYFEFELFMSDSDRYSYVGDSKIQRKNGTIICSKPGQTRYSELPFRCHYLHISSDDEELLRFMNALPDSLTADDTQAVAAMFEALIKNDGTSPSERLKQQGDACRLLSYIFALADRSGTDINPALSTYRKPLLDAAHYIEHHLSEKLCLKTLAQTANLSQVYFHRLFCERFGQTPNQYIFTHRIAAAKMALLSDNVSVAQVAAECGFSSQSYFNHKFKEATGQTPLEYRRYMLGRLKL